MDLTNLTGPNAGQVIAPGQRLLYIKGGYSAAKKYNTPRDVQVPLFDEENGLLFIKYVDVNGNDTVRMFELNEKPIPEFDPNKYVTVDDFNSLKEEMLNAVNSIKQSIGAAASNGPARTSKGNGGPVNRPNNEQREPTANI